MANQNSNTTPAHLAGHLLRSIPKGVHFLAIVLLGIGVFASTTIYLSPEPSTPINELVTMPLILWLAPYGAYLFLLLFLSAGLIIGYFECLITNTIKKLWRK